MSRKRPVPQREKDIGVRLAYLRGLTKLSRAEFGGFLTPPVDSAMLMRVEAGRVPLKYGLAASVIRFYHTRRPYVSPLWLVTGLEPMHTAVPIALPLAVWLGAKDADWFSTIMDGQQQKIASITEAPENWNLPEPWLRAQRELAVEEIVRHRTAEATWGQHLQIVKQKTDPRDLARLLELKVYDGHPLKSLLTSLPITVEVGVDMQGSLPDLIKRLQKATAPRGKKSDLARFLGVPLSSVSRWLSGKPESPRPSGDTALQLLQWLERQEGKSKT